jgi:hypothetical protein
MAVLIRAAQDHSASRGHVSLTNRTLLVAVRGGGCLLSLEGWIEKLGQFGLKRILGKPTPRSGLPRGNDIYRHVLDGELAIQCFPSDGEVHR